MLRCGLLVAGAIGTYGRTTTDEVLELSAFPAVDFSANKLPKVEVGGRVIELFDGNHFDEQLSDTPDELRPPALIAFYGSKTCQGEFDSLRFRQVAERTLPARSRLMIAKYDMDAAPHRWWAKWTPERDLQKRMNVTACPSLVFVPRACNGRTEWCEERTEGAVTVLGCDDFKEQCANTKQFKFSGLKQPTRWQKMWGSAPQQGGDDWIGWVNKLVHDEGEPKINPQYGTYAKQDRWLTTRDGVTVENQMWIYWLNQGIPSFSDKGYKAMQIPEHLQSQLIEFYANNKKSAKWSTWTDTDTHLNYCESPTKHVGVDYHLMQQITAALKDILEEWSGMELEHTSTYGIREYFPGAVLKNHIDRVGTHVISATLCIAKMPVNDEDDLVSLNNTHWPIEGVDWNGRHVRYNHPPASMLLYESAKFVHGRPFPNPDGVHLGLFTHFSPTLPKKHGKWSELAQRAFKHMETYVERIAYTSSAVVEPENPVFTEQYFCKEAESSDPGTEELQFDMSFINQSPEMAYVFWKDPHAGVLILNCELEPKESCTRRTFPGHHFVFSANEDGTFPTDEFMGDENDPIHYHFSGTEVRPLAKHLDYHTHFEL